MKIIHMSYAYIESYHDPETWLERISFFTGLLEGMAVHNEIIAVYNIDFKGKLERSAVTYLFPGFRRSSLQWPFKFNSYIHSLRPDVVVIQGFSPWQTALLARKNPGMKIIVQHRAEKPFLGFKKFLQKQADKYIQSYFFSSAELADPWIDSRQIGSRTKVVEVMGMSSTFTATEKTAAVARTGTHSDLVFLWVGDLNANKNPMLALDAFAEFARRHPSALLVMIYQTGSLEKSLTERTRGLEGSIRLVGKVPHENMSDWYNSADFILSTSHYESAGMSVCEGMSCGCIPVVTNIPSFRMMTDHGRAGLLFDPGSKEALIEALEKCISIDRPVERKKVLGHFKMKLSFDANVRRIEEVINSLR